MVDMCKSRLYIGMHVRVCAEDRSEKVRLGAALHIVIRAGVRWFHSEGACELCCHDIKWSEDVYMCATRGGVNVSCCHSKGACPM